MHRPWLISVFAGLNVALAGMAYHLLKREPASPIPATESVTVRDSAPTDGSPVIGPSAGNPTSSEAFGWSDLQPRELKAYVANLRVVNCPEETIQDIIIAEVDRRYKAREAALGLVRYALKPWEVTSSGKDYDQIAKLRELRLEKQALLKELLGLDIPLDAPEFASKSSHETFEAALEFLPPEKRAAARQIQDRYWQSSERLKQKVDSIFLPEDLEEFRRLRNERRDELARVLTPQEFEELELRSSSTASKMKSQLPALEATEAEFRAIFAARRQFDDNYSLPGQIVGDDGDFARRQQEARNQSEQAVQTALGEARYADYQKAQDATYRAVYQAAQAAGVPKENVAKAYDSIQSSRDEFNQWVAQLNQTPDLTDQERSAAVGEFQKRQRDTVRQLLGDETYKQIEGRLPRFNLPRGRRPPVQPPVPVQDVFQNAPISPAP